jgi:hypothetical protein
VEVLDLCGPFGVFSLAHCLLDPAAWNIFIVAEKPWSILTRAGLGVNPHRPIRLDSYFRYDLKNGTTQPRRS